MNPDEPPGQSAASLAACAALLHSIFWLEHQLWGALFFHLGKFLWTQPLIFIYPR